MNKKRWLILALILPIAVIGWVLNKKYFAKQKPIEVNQSAALRVDITEKVGASGKIQPETEVKISADVSGEITEMRVAEGDSVVAGQLLLRIRPDNYLSFSERARAALEASKASWGQAKAMAAQSAARLERSQLEYKRNLDLLKEKVISQAEFENISANYQVAKREQESSLQNAEAARFNVKSAEAGLKDATENLRKTSIYAPVSGIVSKLSVELGERVVGTSQMAGTEIMRLANLSTMEVLVNVNENDISRISLSDSTEIFIDAFASSEHKFRGFVTAIASTAKPTLSSDAVTEFEVKIRILQSSYAELLKTSRNPLRPGMSASVEIVCEKHTQVLAVPIAAVTTRKDSVIGVVGKPSSTTTTSNSSTADKYNEVIFVIRNDTVAEQIVKTGISDFDNIEILEGLKKSDIVVIGPYLAVSKQLKSGSKIVNAELKTKK